LEPRRIASDLDLDIERERIDLANALGLLALVCHPPRAWGFRNRSARIMRPQAATSPAFTRNRSTT
jgi:hypothetical protein